MNFKSDYTGSLFIQQLLVATSCQLIYHINIAQSNHYPPVLWSSDRK